MIINKKTYVKPNDCGSSNTKKMLCVDDIKREIKNTCEYYNCTMLSEEELFALLDNMCEV